MEPGPLQDTLRRAVIRIGFGSDVPDTRLPQGPGAQCPDGFGHVTLFLAGFLQPVADLYPSRGIRRPFEAGRAGDNAIALYDQEPEGVEKVIAGICGGPGMLPRDDPAKFSGQASCRTTTAQLPFQCRDVVQPQFQLSGRQRDDP